MSVGLDFAHLKSRHRDMRDSQPKDLGTRIHRALSWLGRSEQEADDIDARFIFLWIAFNAAYARELGPDEQYSETAAFNDFIGKLLQCDRDNLLYDIVWEQFLEAIGQLLDNRYAFKPFWQFKKGVLNETQWQQKFQNSRYAAERNFEEMNTGVTLAIVFDRLYVLRNQLIHGNATWNSQLNREQLRQSTEILDRLVPTMIHLMMENPDKDWGPLCYPVVD